MPMQIIKEFFKRKPNSIEATHSEILTSVLIPSGHNNRYIHRNEAEAFFAPYIEYMRQSLEEVYGINNIARRQKKQGKSYDCTFVDTHFLRVEYTISPLENLDARPSVFYGELRIKQPDVNLTQAGQLHKRLFDAHPGQGFTLSYSAGDEPGFNIFLRKGEETLYKGENLLQKMNIASPCESLSYNQIGTKRVWERIPVELRQ